MAKRTLLSVAVFGLCTFLTTEVSALSLKESISEAIETNPVVQERLSNFRSTQQDLDIAKSEWLPSLDYRATIGRNNGGDIFKSNPGKEWKQNASDASYANYTNSLKLTQNIFNGFSTTSKIDYQEARILASANHYVENVNDIAFQMSGAYIDVLRSYQLLQNAKDAVAINQKIYEDVQSLYDQGLTTKSEMTKIYAALALAKSNLVVQQNNTIDREFRFKRVLGRDVDVRELSLPALDILMPSDIDEASKLAIENNPSLIVSHYNTKAAEALYVQKKSKYYPSVDIEAEQLLDNHSKSHGKGAPYESVDDRQRIMLVLNWNLFNGLADQADIQKSRSEINREVETHKDLKRQTIEGLSLSWSAYELLGEQLKDLYNYYDYSKDTLESYQSEYEMGRRTLLDLLSAQNDLISSKSQIINAQMDKLFAQYRILDAMGLLVKSVLDEDEYKKVIDPTINPFVEQKDTLEDKEDTIVYSGARAEAILDSDFDGVADELDKCPNTPFGIPVDENGCELDGAISKYNLTDEAYTKTFNKAKE